jgi:hypothetical protein
MAYSAQSIADRAALIFKNRASVIARFVMNSLLRDYTDAMAVIIIIIIIIIVRYGCLLSQAFSS